MTLVSMSLAVWVGELGIPERFVWKGNSYRVTDTPTRLDFDMELLTHIPSIPSGWRLQGTDDTGGSLIFDLLQFATDGEWHVVRTYR